MSRRASRASDLDEVPLHNMATAGSPDYAAMSHEQRREYWKAESKRRRSKRVRKGQCPGSPRHPKPTDGFKTCEVCRAKERERAAIKRAGKASS